MQSLDKLPPPLDFLPTTTRDEHGVKGYTPEDVAALEVYRAQYAKYRLGEAEGAKGENPTRQKGVVVLVDKESDDASLNGSEAQVQWE